MPVEWSVMQLPSGARYLRIITRGQISREDAAYMIAQHGPGGPLHGVPQLVLTQELTSVSADARAMFVSTPSDDAPWVAMVVVNPVIRVSSNFMIRVNRNKRTRLFPNEASAIQWLEDRLGEEAARAKAT